MSSSVDAWKILVNLDKSNKSFNYLLSYQCNGTIYLKNQKVVDETLQKHLNACAGEIYICYIPAKTCVEQIAQVAAILGEIYVLRFKVNYANKSRGFAYLQYMNPSLMPKALATLPSLFQQYSLPSIRVRESFNISTLILKRVYHLTPPEVYNTLKEIINFNKLVSSEMSRNYFEYQIIFNSNDEAVRARRQLLRSLCKFGQEAIILWDTSVQRSSTKTNNKTNLKKEKEYKQWKDKNAVYGAELPRNGMGAVTAVATSAAAPILAKNNYSILNNCTYDQSYKDDAQCTNIRYALSRLLISNFPFTNNAPTNIAQNQQSHKLSNQIPFPWN